MQAQNSDDLFNGIKSFVFEKKYEQALTQYQAAFDSGVGDSLQLGEAYGYAAICCEELGNVEDAIKYYKLALDYQVTVLSIYDKSVALFQKSGKDDLVEWALKEKVKYFPDFEVAVEKDLNYQYLKTEQYDKLLASSKKMEKWDADSPTYYYYQGLSYQNTGRPDSAMIEYKIALEKDVDYTAANFRLGYMLYEKGDNVFKKSKKTYESIASPTRVDYAQYHKSLEAGKVFLREAEGYLVRAYEKNKDANLKKLLYALYTKLGDSATASKYK
jgi:tetratricopeptide (TPR) repeat protein